MPLGNHRYLAPENCKFFVTFIFCFLISLFIGSTVNSAKAQPCTNGTIVDSISGSINIQKYGEAKSRQLIVGDTVCDEDTISWSGANAYFDVKSFPSGEIYRIVPKRTVFSLRTFMASITVIAGGALSILFVYKAFIIKYNALSKVSLYIGAIILMYELFLLFMAMPL